MPGAVKLATEIVTDVQQAIAAHNVFYSWFNCPNIQFERMKKYELIMFFTF